MQNNNFTSVNNNYKHNLSTLKDQNDLIKIENKTPILKNIGKIIRGETHSNIFTFEMDRYFDNEDLSTKGIQFILKNDDGILVEPATNIEYNEELLRFSYVVSHFATSCKTVTIAIEIYGRIDDEEDYSLKTIPFVLNIEDSLNSSEMNIITVSKNLYINLMNRLDYLADQINGGGSIPDEIFETDPINFTALMEEDVSNEETNR